MVYLSHYEGYPIYEAAEGGYYYSGQKVTESERMSLRKAKQKMGDMIADVMTNRDDYNDGEWFTFDDENHPGSVLHHKIDQYIGGFEIWIIERRLGSEEHGYEWYC